MKMSLNGPINNRIVLDEEYFRQALPAEIRVTRRKLEQNYNSIMYRRTWIKNILDNTPLPNVDPMTLRARDVYFNYEISSLLEILQTYTILDMPTDLLFVLRRLLLTQQRILLKHLEQYPDIF
jgi:hypothetical protein